MDGSSTDQVFAFTVPTVEDYDTFLFSRINIYITDNGIRWGRFGAIPGGLTNGLLIQVTDGAGQVLQHFGTDIHPLRLNEDFTALAGIDNVIAQETGPDFLGIRFSVFKSGERTTIKPGWDVRFVVRDDLSSLVSFRAMAQGVLSRRRPSAGF